MAIAEVDPARGNYAPVPAAETQSARPRSARRLVPDSHESPPGPPHQRDPIARRFGESTADSMAILGGLNTVGVIVASFFVVFMLASAGADSSARPDGSVPADGYDAASETTASPKALTTAEVLQLQQQQHRAAGGGWLPPGLLQPGPDGLPMAAGAQPDASAETTSGLPDGYNAQPVSAPQSDSGAPAVAGECCPCGNEEEAFQERKKAGAGRDNLASAALTLSGLMWAGNHVPQVHGCVCMYSTLLPSPSSVCVCVCACVRVSFCVSVAAGCPTGIKALAHLCSHALTL